MSEEIRLFRPSNGTHGDIFMSAYCFQCSKFPDNPDAKKQCQIFLATLVYDIDEPGYPNQWRYVDGKATCTAFKSREEYNAERRAKRIIATDTATPDLFGDQQ